MIQTRSIRWRMMLLFCAVVGALLAFSYAGFYFMFDRVIRGQLDRRLIEIAAPIIADLITDPDEKDVDQLDIADEYFEVIDSSGEILQRSKNLDMDLPLNLPAPITNSSAFQTIRMEKTGEIRTATIPFHAADRTWVLAVGASTRDVEGALVTLRGFILNLLPLSVILTAV